MPPELFVIKRVSDRGDGSHQVDEVLLEDPDRLVVFTSQSAADEYRIEHDLRTFEEEQAVLRARLNAAYEAATAKYENAMAEIQLLLDSGVDRRLIRIPDKPTAPYDAAAWPRVYHVVIQVSQVI